MEKICLNIIRCYTLDILRYIQILYKIYKRLIMRIEDGYWKIRVQGKNTRAHFESELDLIRREIALSFSITVEFILIHLSFSYKLFCIKCL